MRYDYRNTKNHAVWVINQHPRDAHNEPIDDPNEIPFRYSVMYVDKLEPNESLASVSFVLSEFDSYESAVKEKERRQAMHEYYDGEQNHHNAQLHIPQY